MKNIDLKQIRECMQSVVSSNEASSCLYEVMQSEGFLPDTLEEGESYENHFGNMMEDDDICNEMFTSLMESSNECGASVKKWLKETYTSLFEDEPETDDDDETHFDNDEDDDEEEHYGVGVDINDPPIITKKAVRNPDAETYDDVADNIYEDNDENGDNPAVTKLNKISEFAGVLIDQIKPGQELESWMEDMITMAYQDLAFVSLHLTGGASKAITPTETEPTEPETMIQPQMSLMGSLEEEDDEDDDEGNDAKYLIRMKGELSKSLMKFTQSMSKLVSMMSDHGGIKTFLLKQDGESEYDYFNRLIKKGSGDFNMQRMFKYLYSPASQTLAKEGGRLFGDNLDEAGDILSDIFGLQEYIIKKEIAVSKLEQTGANKRAAHAEPDIDVDVEDDDLDKAATMAAAGAKSGINFSNKSAIPAGGNDFEDDEDDLFENELPKFAPVKGKSVDSENKTNANKENTESETAAEDSQKTIQQKTDELTNQKFSPNMENGQQKEMRNFHLGYKNPLNLDFSNDVSDSYKKRVELEITTGDSRPRDEKIVGKKANIDAESTKRTGEAIIQASKDNQKFADADYQGNPILTKNEPYERTSITGSKTMKGKGVNEELERIKRLFGYEDQKLTEDVETKKSTIQEGERFMKSISKKKFL